MISYDAMVTEVTARLGNRSDIGTRISRWINYAMLEIVQNPRFDFREFDAAATFATTASQGTYFIFDSAPRFWFLLDILDFTNRRKLMKTHWSVIDKIRQTTGQPVRYFLFANQITLDPVPDAIYQIIFRYRFTPTELIPGADFDQLGNEWEEPIVTLATIKGAQALGMSDVAVANRQLIEPMLASRIDRPALEDMDSETTIAPSGDMLSFIPVM